MLEGPVPTPFCAVTATEYDVAANKPVIVQLVVIGDPLLEIQVNVILPLVAVAE